MTEAPHQPFEDLTGPPRTDRQKGADERHNKEQTDRLEVDVMSAEQTPDVSQADGVTLDDQGLDDLDRELLDRRKHAGAAVRLGTIRTDTDQWSLVVPGQVIAHIPGDRSEDAQDALANSPFETVGQPPSEVCPELEGRLTLLRYKQSIDEDDSTQRLQRDDDMRATLATLNNLPGPGAQVTAAPRLVTALQKVIVKAAIGPAPTAVGSTDPATMTAFRAAGLHAPTGGVVVAVIDTGIADVERTDGWLNEVLREPGRIDPLDALPVPGNGCLDFAAGHGTFAAGIVRLVDPEAEIKVYQALDSDGFADETAIACAMIRAVQEGASVLSLSFGMQTIDGKPSVALQQALEVIDEITDDQTRPVIVAAAGNYGNEEKVWPAAFSARRPSSEQPWDAKVVSVAGLTAEHDGVHRGADWSTRGEWVTCSCVGSGIVSTFVPGEEDPKFTLLRPGAQNPDSYPLGGTGDSWAVWSGTSFAAPQVAGAISRLCREGSLDPSTLLTPFQARDQLLQDADVLDGFPAFGKALLLLPGT